MLKCRKDKSHRREEESYSAGGLLIEYCLHLFRTSRIVITMFLNLRPILLRTKYNKGTYHFYLTRIRLNTIVEPNFVLR